MPNPRLAELPEYAFPRLRQLLDEIPPGQAPIDMTIGEPRHGAPDFIAPILTRYMALYGKYPPIGGTPEWQRAAGQWLARRYGLDGRFRPERNLLPLNGTREGLFSVAFVTVPPERNGQRPAVLLPNPFYQCYAAAALAAGAEPIYVDARRETNFMPDFAALPPEILARTALAYLCTPANPQGSVASLEDLKAHVTLARANGFTLVVDECYGEIYGDAPPAGALEACMNLADEDGDPFAAVLVFHSLSKRSGLAGLRSGLVAGDAALIAAFRQFRSYVGPTMPLPLLAAAAAAWDDEAHVEANRALYRAKFDLAEEMLSGRFGFYRPAGGFFLWLEVEEGEAAAVRLWREAGLRVLPGRYLSHPGPDGASPGDAYIRLALVDDMETTRAGLERLISVLGS